MRTLRKESEEIAILGITTEQDLRLTKITVHNDKGHSSEWQSLSTQTDGFQRCFGLNLAEPSWKKNFSSNWGTLILLQIIIIIIQIVELLPTHSFASVEQKW